MERRSATLTTLNWVEFIQLVIGASVLAMIFVSSKHICELVSAKIFKKVTQTYVTNEECKEKRHYCLNARKEFCDYENQILMSILKAIITLISYSDIPEKEKNEILTNLKIIGGRV